MASDAFHTLILGGGYGTRLGELGKKTPKPLLKILGKPILDHILENVQEIVPPSQTVVLINTKFAAQYRAWLAQKKESDFVTLIHNEEGSGMSPDIVTNIALTIERLGIDSDLLVVGGDNFFDFRLQDFMDFSRAHGLSGVVVDVKSLEDAKRFSVVSLNDQNQITRLTEKPICPDSSIVTTCIYWFPEKDLRYFQEYSQENPKAESLGQFVQWLSMRESLFGYRCGGNWYDIGTKEMYEALAGKL